MEVCPILCPILIGGFQNENGINKVEMTCLDDIFLMIGEKDGNN